MTTLAKSLVPDPTYISRLIASGAIKVAAQPESSSQRAYDREAYLRRREKLFAAGLTSHGKARQRERMVGGDA